MATPHQLVGNRAPEGRYLPRRLAVPTAPSAELVFGSYPVVDVL